MEASPLAHLRPYWWAYGVASVVAAVAVLGGVVLGTADLETWFDAAYALAVVVAAGLVQCVALVVVHRRPPSEPASGDPTVWWSIVIGLVLFGVLFNPYALLVLGAMSCGTVPFAWFVVLPVAFLISTYREVMRDD